MVLVDCSIVIPIYNSEATLPLVLTAIFNSKLSQKSEVVLVDDGSKNISKIKKIIANFPKNKIRLLTQKHLGPAVARNFGVKKSKGNLIIFLDSDVLVEPDCLNRIVKNFAQDKNLTALNGVYSKKPANPSFFTWYFSLFKYHQWVKSNQKDFTGFSTRLGAVKKDIFQNLGGFDSRYQDALVEDYEFGYRLRKNHKVSLNNKVAGAHFHPGFTKCFKNYYQRVYLWLKLFGQRKQFDNITTTKSVGLANGFGFLALVFSPLIFFSKVSFLFSLPFLVSFLIFFFIYLDFHIFVFKEKGLLFTILAFFTSLILSLPLGLALIKFFLLDCLKLKIVFNYLFG